ncbi:MAG: hypothetical protein PHU68_12630 [Paludibacter sp.]|nr:hypothetical protein [Paludibacter sp.]
MNILVANNHLKRTGGTENYTYALIVELLRLGHEVEYFTFKKGVVSKKIEELGVRFRSKKNYDLILANHKTTVQLLHKRGYTIQTCHGVLPTLEQPSRYADAYVSVTPEVHRHLQNQGIDSVLIYNGIDCQRFYPKKELRQQLSCVLSLCQSDEANELLEKVCRRNNLTLLRADKKKDGIWQLEELINEADLVVGIGRSLYDAMACGRTVLSFDQRKYSDAFGDGYLTEQSIENSIQFNCSGRGSKRRIDASVLESELLRYNPQDGTFMRSFALKHTNIEHSVQQYLAVYAKRDRSAGKSYGLCNSFLWSCKAGLSLIPSFSTTSFVKRFSR